jgi:hypothetical protein
MADNESTCGAVARIIAAQLWPAEDEQYHRVRCGNHIWNLLAIALLDPKYLCEEERILAGVTEDDLKNGWLWDSALGRGHRLGVYTSTGNRYERFTDLWGTEKPTDEDGDPIRVQGLLKLGGIRWNQCYNMLCRLIKLQPIIEVYQKLELLHHKYPVEDKLTSDDWAELRAYKLALEPLMEITKRCEGNGRDGTHGSLWEILSSMNYLWERWADIKSGFDTDHHIHRGMRTP